MIDLRTETVIGHVLAGNAACRPMGLENGIPLQVRIAQASYW